MVLDQLPSGNFLGMELTSLPKMFSSSHGAVLFSMKHLGEKLAFEHNFGQSYFKSAKEIISFAPSVLESPVFTVMTSS